VSNKQTGWPFQEGYAVSWAQELHVFTDYRWNDGSESRRWHISPEKVDLQSVVVRPFSLSPSDGAVQ